MFTTQELVASYQELLSLGIPFYTEQAFLLGIGAAFYLLFFDGSIQMVFDL